MFPQDGLGALGARRFAEVFAGIGAGELGLERAGWQCAWHAELAPFPRRVLTQHWPDVPLYGDVQTLDGADLVARHGAITLIAGGSPCQDLSVAGRRSGLAGARSGLFFQQLRLWDETGATFCLWENVPGALSSHRGTDFARILSAFVGGALTVPRARRRGPRLHWRRAGVVRGPRGVAAWRVLDAQWFGVPQRRRRVFVLGARTGRVDPATVLSLADGVPRHSPSRRYAWPDLAATARASTSGERRDDSAAVARGESARGSADGRAPINRARVFVAFQETQRGAQLGEVHATLDANGGSRRHTGVLAVDDTDVFARCAPGASSTPSEDIGILPFDRTQITSRENRCRPEPGDPCHPLAASGYPPAVVYITPAPQRPAIGADRSADHTERGSSTGKPSGARSQVASAQFATDTDITDRLAPRRLTPRECERLMGLPDDWTLVPGASDSARYRACGNAEVTYPVQWIGLRLREAIDRAT